MSKEEIILFGASRLGEIAFNILKDKHSILYFSDNDKNKWGKSFCGIKIMAPKELSKFSKIKIIIASMHYGEISVQLKNMGLENIYIFSYADSKKYFIDKMCNLDIYKNFKLDEDFKSEFIDNFSIIYGNKESSRNNTFEKITGDEKNVLIIAYFFPPIGGGGVQRTLKFVKYLKGFSWNPIVVTVGEEYSPEKKDFSLLDEIPRDIDVYRMDHESINSEQLDFDTAQQIFNLIYGLIDDQDIINQYISKIKKGECVERNRIFEPDIYISWVNGVLRYIEKIIDFKKIDMIYTTSSPYSDHIIGYYLKKKYDIPWVADYRDEWTNGHYKKEVYKGDESRVQLHRCMEQNIVDFANKIITVSSTLSENYRNIFKLQYNKVVTITNGYDEEDFGHISNTKSYNKKFTVLYYGSLYLNRTLENIILAINESIEDRLIDKKLVEFRIIGRIDVGIKDKLKNIDKHLLIRYTNYLPHLKCLKEASESNLLLLPYGKGEAFKAGYTGKVFEYIRLMIPILSLSPKGSEIEMLLNETKCGENFEYDDLVGIKAYILKQYNRWISGELDFNVNETKIQEYERKRLTEKLSEVFNSLI